MLTIDSQVRWYRKLPVEIQAVEWDPEHPDTVLRWLDMYEVPHKVDESGQLFVSTLESGDDLDPHKGKPGDLVIKGIKGEFYVCDRAIFEGSYQDADLGFFARLRAAWNMLVAP